MGERTVEIEELASTRRRVKERPSAQNELTITIHIHNRSIIKHETLVQSFINNLIISNCRNCTSIFLTDNTAPTLTCHSCSFSPFFSFLCTCTPITILRRSKASAAIAEDRGSCRNDMLKKRTKICFSNVRQGSLPVHRGRFGGLKLFLSSSIIDAILRKSHSLKKICILLSLSREQVQRLATKLLTCHLSGEGM